MTIKRDSNGWLFLAAALAIAAVTMTGCGGGGGGSPTPPSSETPTPTPPPPPPPPPSLAGPTITLQPADATVVTGAVAFSVGASAVGNVLSYEWERSDDAGSSWRRVPGGTAATLPLTVSLGDHETQYRVVVTANGQSATSRAARLAVLARTSLLAGASGGSGFFDGIGDLVRFSAPGPLAFDSGGNLVVADRLNNRLRSISPTGAVTTLVDGPGTLPTVQGVATAPGGVIFVAVSGNSTIARIDSTGTMTTFAGRFQGGVDGIGTAARFNQPGGLAIDLAGNLIVADTYNHAIRRIAPNGTVTTIAGSLGVPGFNDGSGAAARFREPQRVAIDSSGNIFVSDGANHAIRRIAADGTVTTIAGFSGQDGYADGVATVARFNRPAGISVTANGSLIVADTNNALLRTISTAGVVSTLAGIPGFPGYADGNALSARFYCPTDVVTDPAGNTYVADSCNAVIRRVSANGEVTTFAGSAPKYGVGDGPGPMARFFGIEGIAVDANHRLLAVEGSGHSVRQISSSGQVSLLAGARPVAQSGGTDGIGTSARFSTPFSVAVGTDGSAYVGEFGGCTIRRITPAGVTTTLAGASNQCGFADGVGSAARLTAVTGIAVDSAGNVFASDNTTRIVRKVSPSGAVSTFAGTAGGAGAVDGQGPGARFNLLFGIVVDRGGNVFVADWTTIRRITPNGMVTTIAGSAAAFPLLGAVDGPGPQARFGLLGQMAIDAQDNLFVVDRSNSTIRKISPTGFVSTVIGQAGMKTIRLGLDPLINQPTGVAVRSDGRVLIATEQAILITD